MTLLFFKDGSPVAQEVDLFVDEKLDFDKLPLLKVWRFKLRLLRGNELSVERLHRLGSLFAAGASNRSMVYVAFKLRSPDYWRPPYGFTLSEFAETCEVTRRVPNILTEFMFERHPEIEKQQLKIQEKTGCTTSTNIGHKTIREVFYHNDQSSMFDDFSSLAKAIASYNDMVQQQHEQSLQHPLEVAADDCATNEQKLHALRVRYAFRHWKDI